MTNLLLAALFLPASHFFISSTPLRAALIGRLGERPYLNAYSVVAVAAFGWLIGAYIGAAQIAVWSPPSWVKALSGFVGVVAMVFVVAGLTTRNPVSGRSGALFDSPDIVRGILRVTRNAFFWGSGLLAAAHAIAAADAAGMLAFGSVAFLGLARGALMDARKSRSGDERWARFARRHLQHTLRGGSRRSPARRMAGDRSLAVSSGCSGFGRHVGHASFSRASPALRRSGTRS